MKLAEALQLIDQGKTLRRASWLVRDVRIVGSMPSQTKLRRECHTETDKRYKPSIVAGFGNEIEIFEAPAWQPTPEDLIADDYEIYTPPDVSAADVESTGFDGEGLRTAVASDASEVA